MAKTPRFSKARVVAGLRSRAEFYRQKHGFDPYWGTAQLMLALASSEPRQGETQAQRNKRALDVAVDYGTYREAENLATWIEEGSWPVEGE